MTLWRLEFLRLWRTRRWLILVGVFVFFGVLGPVTARFLPDLMDAIGEDAVGSLPPMGPPDGITQYIGNAAQIGLLALAFVGAAAMAFDAKVEMAIFLRTRASVRAIVTPRLVLTSAAAVGSFLLGLLVAYVATGLLLDWLDASEVLIGGLLMSLYLVFAVALIGFVASLIRSVPGVALISVGILIAIGLLSLVSTLAAWLPGALVGAIDTLVRGGPFTYWRAIATTVVLIAVLVPVTIRRLDAREL